MKGHENLRPQNTRTKAEQREIATMGGIASGAARREKKTFKDTLLAILEMTEPGEEHDNRMLMNIALYKEARSGNTKAYELVRDTIGEAPILKTEQRVIDGSQDFKAFVGALTNGKRHQPQE